MQMLTRTTWLIWRTPRREKFVTLPPVAHHTWNQGPGVSCSSTTSRTSKVADAMTRAGFDRRRRGIHPSCNDQPKKEVDSSHKVVDLRNARHREDPPDAAPTIDNGEGQAAPRRTFKLLAVDTEYLDGISLRWETVIEANRRWLLMYDHPAPSGFRAGARCSRWTFRPTTRVPDRRSTFAFRRSPGRAPPSIARRCGRRTFPAWSTRAGSPSNAACPGTVFATARANAPGARRELPDQGDRRRPHATLWADRAVHGPGLQTCLFPGDGKEAAAIPAVRACARGKAVAADHAGTGSRCRTPRPRSEPRMC